MPAARSEPEKQVSSTRTTSGSTSGPTAATSRRWIWAPIRSRRCFTSGLELSSATVQASTSAGLSVVNSTMAATASVEPPGHRSLPLACRCLDRGKVLYPAPEHLGQQVVLRAEVVVRGRRRHARPAGHVADGEPRVSDLLDLVAGGP